MANVSNLSVAVFFDCCTCLSVARTTQVQQKPKPTRRHSTQRTVQNNSGTQNTNTKTPNTPKSNSKQQQKTITTTQRHKTIKQTTNMRNTENNTQQDKRNANSEQEKGQHKKNMNDGKLGTRMNMKTSIAKRRKRQIWAKALETQTRTHEEQEGKEEEVTT